MYRNDLSPVWRALQHLQSSLTASTRYSVGRDEAFTALVESLPLSDAGDLNRRFRNLERNRRHKHEHRRLLLQLSSEERGYAHAPDPFDTTAIQEEVELVKSQTSGQEWSMLLELANDQPIRTIATRYGLSEVALKCYINRLRKRIRKRSCAHYR